MAQVKMKGYITLCSGVQKAKSSGEFYEMEFLEPGRTDDFGEKVGKDSFFKITAFGKAIEKIPVEWHGKALHSETVKGIKVEVSCYLNGSRIISEGKENFYPTNLNLSTLTVLP